MEQIENICDNVKMGKRAGDIKPSPPFLMGERAG
jgi:hypothetical protein